MHRIDREGVILAKLELRIGSIRRTGAADDQPGRRPGSEVRQGPSNLAFRLWLDFAIHTRSNSLLGFGGANERLQLAQQRMACDIAGRQSPTGRYAALF